MAASSDPHGGILNGLEYLARARRDAWEQYWGSVGEFRPYERFVGHYDRFFLLTSAGAGQTLKDFEKFCNLFS